MNDVSIPASLPLQSRKTTWAWTVTRIIASLPHHVLSVSPAHVNTFLVDHFVLVHDDLHDDLTNTITIVITVTLLTLSVSPVCRRAPLPCLRWPRTAFKERWIERHGRRQNTLSEEMKRVTVEQGREDGRKWWELTETLWRLPYKMPGTSRLQEFNPPINNEFLIQTNTRQDINMKSIIQSERSTYIMSP